MRCFLNKTLHVHVDLKCSRVKTISVLCANLEVGHVGLVATSPQQGSLENTKHKCFKITNCTDKRLCISKLSLS